ncbi:Protein of unknown function [Pyronema omphalodes CBS 100304]|uniref:Uncharacterized protein n=1 Tax=Pyronema omphalodes (strain CBS 100304) TaxID=1076935 RepID=U4LE08_PYROM|nr:Protein of unknown function [Pyronema omphalodes CBS 100304]
MNTSEGIWNRWWNTLGYCKFTFGIFWGWVNASRLRTQGVAKAISRFSPTRAKVRAYTCHPQYVQSKMLFKIGIQTKIVFADLGWAKLGSPRTRYGYHEYRYYSKSLIFRKSANTEYSGPAKLWIEGRADFPPSPLLSGLKSCTNVTTPRHAGYVPARCHLRHRLWPASCYINQPLVLWQRLTRQA